MSHGFFSTRRLFQALRRGQRDDSGAGLVEFAFVAGLVFFPLVFGVIEFGRAVFAKTTLTAAAREGVRYAIVRGSESGSVADSAMVANYVKGRTPLSPIVVKPSWTPNKNPGSVAQVQVTYTYLPIVPLIPSKVLTSTSQQVIAF
ncbi:MAG: pilus assembly protein [Gemmatimonadaceae bacterium]|nr:pilus assembly protein [Gemmatimonadaceae bacterium]